MLELLRSAVEPVNLPLSILLALVLIFWLFAILGALDMSTFEFDADADVDVDGNVSISHGLLTFFNVGDVPLMVLLSFFVLSMWSIALLSTHFLNVHSALPALGLLAPNIIVSALVTKVVSAPFARLTRMLKQDEDAAPQAIGSICTLLYEADDTRLSQGEVDTDGDPLRLTVQARPGESFPKGSQAIVVDYDPEKEVYIIEKFDDWKA